MRERARERERGGGREGATNVSHRCRANLEHISQARLDSDLSFQVEYLETVQSFPDRPTIFVLEETGSLVGATNVILRESERDTHTER